MLECVRLIIGEGREREAALSTKAALPLPIVTAMTGLAPVCCCVALRQSCLVVSLVVSLGIQIVGGVARSLDRTTSHTQKHKSF